MFTTPTSIREIEYTGPVQRGAQGLSARRVQEWLAFHGHRTAIDSDYGEATERAVQSFQRARGLPVDGRVMASTWETLLEPMQAAVSFTPQGRGLAQAMKDVAAAHVAQNPIELGGDNRGAWVRLYMDGNEGRAWRWCAGFVFFVMRQACSALGKPQPLRTTFSCDTLAGDARAAGRLVPWEDIASGVVPWSDLGPLSIFLCRRTPGDWTHTGFAFEGRGNTFATMEGNTNDDGSSNGFEVCCRLRGVKDKDFVVLQP